MVERYSGAERPDRPTKTQIVRVTTPEPQQFILVSTAIFGQWVHWYGKRTHQCTRDKSKCNGCFRGWPQKWLGYVNALDITGANVFVELTNTACDLLCKVIPEDRPLRGFQIRIKKTRGGKHGRYLIECLERRVDPVTLPQERDPLTTLLFLWKCKNQHASEGDDGLEQKTA